MFFHGPTVAVGVTAGLLGGAAALLTGDTGLLPRYTITATTRMTITTGAISNPSRTRCEGMASPPLRRPAGTAARPLPLSWRPGPAAPWGAPCRRPGPARTGAGGPPGPRAAAGAPRAPAGEAAGPFRGGPPVGGRPAAGRPAGRLPY